MSRIATLAVVLVSLGLLVHATPIAAPESGKEVANLEERGYNCYGSNCYGGLDLVTMMTELQRAIEYKLSLLDGCLTGGDYATIIYDIHGLLMAACGAIKGYNIGLLGLLTGKLLIIAKIWFAIVISIATHCSKWYGHVEFAVFCELISKIDLALKMCFLAICNLGGIFGGFFGICFGLFTKVHIALLVKVKFYLCLEALGLNY
ncbi:hypothetical protein RhiJN_07061 [Ceratobasidium sp. AG-Ba]|nr:hypothetical protein RhiJN_07061 [Ceratobasidium sp. AG-Ba]QRW07943.1 hypothetical protein RhiLY_06942 [Ceratobasidium sp. AG-Ba]